MNLLDYLDTLRAKPVHVRKRIAFVTTLALSFLIASVWWTSQNTTAGAMPTRKIAETPTPWAVAWDTLGNAKDAAIATMSNAKSGLEAVVSSNNLAGVSDAMPEENSAPTIPLSDDTMTTQ